MAELFHLQVSVFLENEIPRLVSPMILMHLHAILMYMTRGTAISTRSLKEGKKPQTRNWNVKGLGY